MNKVLLKKIEEIINDKELDDDMKLMLMVTYIKAMNKANRKSKKGNK